MQIVAEIERQKASQNGNAVAVHMSQQTWQQVQDELWRTYHINIIQLRISVLLVKIAPEMKDGTVRVLDKWISG